MTFPAFIHFHDFLRFCWCSWLFEILFILWLSLFLFIFMTFWDIVHINDFPCFPWFCSFMTFLDFPCFYSFSWLFEILFIFMTFWDFVHVHDLRFCSFSWFFEILFIFMAFPFFLHFRTFWDFVHVHEILFMFTPLYKMTGKCEPKSCSVVHPKIKNNNFHSCSFNLCCVKRCRTEGENLKERDFLNVFS